MTFFQTFTEYIDGARLYLEADGADSLKENIPGVREIKIHFAEFLRLLIDSFTRKLSSVNDVMAVRDNSGDHIYCFGYR